MKIKTFVSITCTICITYVPEKRAKMKNIIPRDRRIFMRQRRKVSNHLNQQLKDRLKSLLKEKLSEVQNKWKLPHEKEMEERETWTVKDIKWNYKAFYTLAKENAPVRYKIGPLLNEYVLLTADTGKISESLDEQFELISLPHRKIWKYTKLNPHRRKKIINYISITEDVILAIDEMKIKFDIAPRWIPGSSLEDNAA